MCKQRLNIAADCSLWRKIIYFWGRRITCSNKIRSIMMAKHIMLMCLSLAIKMTHSSKIKYKETNEVIKYVFCIAGQNKAYSLLQQQMQAASANRCFCADVSVAQVQWVHEACSGNKRKDLRNTTKTIFLICFVVMRSISFSWDLFNVKSLEIPAQRQSIKGK